MGLGGTPDQPGMYMYQTVGGPMRMYRYSDEVQKSLWQNVRVEGLSPYARNLYLEKYFISRLAAGCSHTTVALELSAGQARAAELTRTQGAPTTQLPPPAERIVGAYRASN